MLRLTLERVGPDGQAKNIGTAVIGRWAGGHISAVTVDWGGVQVGRVEDHDPAEGVWALVRDALTSCLDGEGELTDAQLAALERALQGGTVVGGAGSGLTEEEIDRIRVEAEDQQDIFGVPAWPDHTDMVDERGIIRRLAGDVLTLLKAMGVEVEDARDE